MAKETTVARTPEDLQRRYRFKNIEITKDELDEFLDNLAFDNFLSSTSTNPVQNRTITLALASKVTSVTGKGLSTNDFTNEDKIKVENMPTITQADIDRWNAAAGTGWTPPIGYIWISTDSTNPDSLFDGTTWEAMGGRVLIGADSNYTAGDTGGSDTHVHTVSNAYAKMTIWASDNNKLTYDEKSIGTAWTSNYGGYVSSPGSMTKDSNYGVGLGGSTDGASNMMPYTVVYMWKRVS